MTADHIRMEVFVIIVIFATMSLRTVPEAAARSAAQRGVTASRGRARGAACAAIKSVAAFYVASVAFISGIKVDQLWIYAGRRLDSICLRILLDRSIIDSFIISQDLKRRRT